MLAEPKTTAEIGFLSGDIQHFGNLTLSEVTLKPIQKNVVEWMFLKYQTRGLQALTVT